MDKTTKERKKERKKEKRIWGEKEIKIAKKENVNGEINKWGAKEKKKREKERKKRKWRN